MGRKWQVGIKIGQNAYKPNEASTSFWSYFPFATILFASSWSIFCQVLHTFQRFSPFSFVSNWWIRIFLFSLSSSRRGNQINYSIRSFIFWFLRCTWITLTVVAKLDFDRRSQFNVKPLCCLESQLRDQNGGRFWKDCQAAHADRQSGHFRESLHSFPSPNVKLTNLLISIANWLPNGVRSNRVRSTDWRIGCVRHRSLDLVRQIFYGTASR